MTAAFSSNTLYAWSYLGKNNMPLNNVGALLKYMLLNIKYVQLNTVLGACFHYTRS